MYLSNALFVIILDAFFTLSLENNFRASVADYVLFHCI